MRLPKMTLRGQLSIPDIGTWGRLEIVTEQTIRNVNFTVSKGQFESADCLQRSK